MHLPKILYINVLKPETTRFCACFPCCVYGAGGGKSADARRAHGCKAGKNAPRRTRNFTRAVYRAVTLLAGDVVFDGVGVLQTVEFDGEAIFDVANHTARRLADRHRRADRWAQIGIDRDRRAGRRNVDHAAGYIGAVRQDQAAERIARREAAVTAVFRQIEDCLLYTSDAADE